MDFNQQIADAIRHLKEALVQAKHIAKNELDVEIPRWIKWRSTSNLAGQILASKMGVTSPGELSDDEMEVGYAGLRIAQANIEDLEAAIGFLNDQSGDLTIYPVLFALKRLENLWEREDFGNLEPPAVEKMESALMSAVTLMNRTLGGTANEPSVAAENWLRETRKKREIEEA